MNIVRLYSSLSVVAFVLFMVFIIGYVGYTQYKFRQLVNTINKHKGSPWKIEDTESKVYLTYNKYNDTLKYDDTIAKLELDYVSSAVYQIIKDKKSKIFSDGNSVTLEMGKDDNIIMVTLYPI